jgi:hypothetical protein
LNELEYEIVRVRNNLIEKYVKTQKHKLAEALASAGDDETHRLLQKAKELDNLLKTYKGA